MKFLFDQNISHRILSMLPDQFKESTSVKNEHLINETDLTIWEFAKHNNYTIITQDSDFNDLTTLFGFPPKIIWIRTGNIKTEEIADLLISNFESIQSFVNDDDLGCFEIIRLIKR